MRGRPPTSIARRAASTATSVTIAELVLLVVVLAALALAACGGGSVSGTPVAASSPSSASGAPSAPGGDAGPTADVAVPGGVPAERTRTFPPGGPVACEPDYEIPLCFSPEIKAQRLVQALKKRDWNCYRRGQMDKADLEVSDTFDCRGGQVEGQLSLTHAISGGTVEDRKNGPVEELRLVASAGERGSGNGKRPTDADVMKHSRRLVKFAGKQLWGKTHPGWVKELVGEFRTLQANCGMSSEVELSMGYVLGCMAPIGFDVEGTSSITQSITLDPPLDNKVDDE
jgi:hypothetical protein